MLLATRMCCWPCGLLFKILVPCKSILKVMKRFSLWMLKDKPKHLPRCLHNVLNQEEWRLEKMSFKNFLPSIWLTFSLIIMREKIEVLFFVSSSGGLKRNVCKFWKRITIIHYFVMDVLTYYHLIISVYKIWCFLSFTPLLCSNLKLFVYRKYAPMCSACDQLIIPKEDGTDSYTVECLGRSYHENCYRCEVRIYSADSLLNGLTDKHVNKADACYSAAGMSFFFSAGLWHPALPWTKRARLLSFGRENVVQSLPCQPGFWATVISPVLAASKRRLSVHPNDSHVPSQESMRHNAFFDIAFNYFPICQAFREIQINFFLYFIILHSR